MSVLSRVLRSGEGKKIKALEALVPDINALESKFTALSDEQLKGCTGEFRQRLDNGEELDDLLVDAKDVSPLHGPVLGVFLTIQ